MKALLFMFLLFLSCSEKNVIEVNLLTAGQRLTRQDMVRLTGSFWRDDEEGSAINFSVISSNIDNKEVKYRIHTWYGTRDAFILVRNDTILSVWRAEK